MPKRTNDFQKLVYLVRIHLANGAKVTESKMMRDRVTKRWREVDVHIKGCVGSHPVVVCIECRDHKRVADVTWVDTMKSKHDRLATNALILASRSGFTPEARDVAKAYGIETFTLDEVDSADFPALLGPQSDLWFKSLTVSADRVSVRVAPTQMLEGETVATTPDNLIYTGEGTELCQIRPLVEKLLQSAGARDYFLVEGKEEHKWFEAIWEPPQDLIGRPLYMKKMEPEVLREIESIRIVGPCKVEISRFGLRHAMLGGIHVAWGKTQVSGREALAVATLDTSGEKKFSLNFSGPAPN